MPDMGNIRIKDENMNKTTIITNVQTHLFELQDLKYRDFHAKLMPTVNKEKIIGVRTPALRVFAKKYGKTDEAKGALVFAADYLDKKIPEKKLRYSNPWIEGMFSVIYFLCYMLWFFLRKDEWRTLPMAEQMSLWAIIVVGSIVGFCVRVFLARKKRRSAV